MSRKTALFIDLRIIFYGTDYRRPDYKTAEPIAIDGWRKLWDADLHRFSQINYSRSAWRRKKQCSKVCEC